MSQHPNARLTPRGRETLVSRIEAGAGVAEAARQMGVSRQTASKWLARARRGEPMSDRSSRPRRLARLTPPDAEARVRDARSSMLLALLALAAAAGVPARTCARVVARSELPRLADVDRVTGEVCRRGPVTPVRYERKRPGGLVHVDVKKVAGIPDGGGWRARGASTLARPDSGAGYARPHVAVDDFSRVAYAEPLPDERKGACSAFMARCPALFAGLGAAVERVTADSGPGCRSLGFNAPLAAGGVRHVYAKPYGPWRNGKVERMNRTLAQERQYGRAWDGEAERADALPAFVEHYNWNRPHSACGGRPPMSRIVGVNSLYWHTTPSAFSSPRAFALRCLGILAASGPIEEGCAMGFFSEFKKAMSGEEGGERYVVADKLVRCPHCGGDRFFEGSALLDSRGTSLFGVEWLGNGATTLTCANCGHVDWFADSGLIERVSG